MTERGDGLNGLWFVATFPLIVLVGAVILTYQLCESIFFVGKAAWTAVRKGA